MKASEVLDNLKKKISERTGISSSSIRGFRDYRGSYNEHPEFEKSNLIERFVSPIAFSLSV